MQFSLQKWDEPSDRRGTTTPDEQLLQSILDKAKSSAFRVIETASPTALQICAVQALFTGMVRNLPINLSLDSELGILEVNLTAIHNAENGFFQKRQDTSVNIGTLQISDNEHGVQILLHPGVSALLNSSEIAPHQARDHIASEVLMRLNDVKYAALKQLNTLQELNNREYFLLSEKIPEPVLASALEIQNLQFNPFENSITAALPSINDAIELDSRNLLKDSASKQFAAINILNRLRFAKKHQAQSFEPFQNVAEQIGITLPQSEELQDYLLTNRPYASADKLRPSFLSRSDDSIFYLSVLDEKAKPVAQATVWRSARNSSSKFDEYFSNNNAENVSFEITKLSKKAPKGTTDKLRKLIRIVAEQTNAKDVVELKSGHTKKSAISATEIIPQVEVSTLAAKRMLRLACGQIFLAQARVAEALDDTNLTQEQKDFKCEEAGKDLSSWFQVASSSLLPKQNFGSDNTQSTIAEWTKLAEHSPLYSLLDTARSNAFNAQFFGSSWFNPGNKGLPNNWETFKEHAGNRINEINSVEYSTENAQVIEFQLDRLTPSVKTALAAMLQKWRIDDKIKMRQRGFEWSVTAEELDSYLRKDSSIFQIILINQKPAGVLITFTDITNTEDAEQKMPSKGGAKASRQWCRDNNIPYEHAVYCFMVGVDRDLNPQLHSQGVDSYALLLEAMQETAAYFGAKYALGGVRIDGKNHLANLAISAHFEKKWVPEPYEFKNRIGSSLTLVSRRIPEQTEFLLDAFPYSAYTWPGYSNLEMVLGDPALIAKKEKSAAQQITDGDKAEKFMRSWIETHNFQSFLKTYADVGTLSGDQHGLSVWKGNLQYYFYQVAPNRDLWKNRDSDQVQPLSAWTDWLINKIRNGAY